MTRYAAFLREVSPLNAKMPELKKCFEQAGFKNVVTVLSSGNIVFDANTSSTSALEVKIESTLKKHLGREFMTIVRSIETLKVDAGLVFTTYRPHPKGAVFMQMLEKEFGKEITTRTWDTIKKVATK